MTMERYGVALLKNTRDAMVIEERAKKEGLAVYRHLLKYMPVAAFH